MKAFLLSSYKQHAYKFKSYFSFPEYLRSQYLPPYCSGQLHSRELDPTNLHVPPFWQGLGWQRLRLLGSAPNTWDKCAHNKAIRKNISNKNDLYFYKTCLLHVLQKPTAAKLNRKVIYLYYGDYSQAVDNSADIYRKVLFPQLYRCRHFCSIQACKSWWLSSCEQKKMR